MVVSVPEEPVPLRQLTVLYLSNCAHYYTICSVFSYVGVMTVDLGWAANRDDAGYVAGFVQSSNLITRIFSAGLWGWASQRFGLKKSLLASLFSLVLGSFLFGFCTSLWSAILVRGSLLGFLNGMTTILNPLAAEIAGPARSGQVLIKVYAVTGFVVLVGPAIGGWTYSPTLVFPALWPNLIGTVLGIVAVVACWHWLPDDVGSKVQSESEGSDFASVMATCSEYPLKMLILLRGLQGSLEYGLNEVLPLYSISSVGAGGLGLSQNDVGTGFMLAACLTIPLNYYGVELLLGQAGLRSSLIICGVITAVCMSAIPFCGYRMVVLMYILAASPLDGMACAICGMCNNRIRREMRGPVNGLVVTVESAFKGVSPALFSACFAWSLSVFGPIGHHLVFLLFGAICAFITVHSIRLPAYVDDPLDGESPSQAKVPLATELGRVDEVCVVGKIITDHEELETETSNLTTVVDVADVRSDLKFESLIPPPEEREAM